MKVRARCNKRSCQARKTFDKPIDPNDRIACHKPGCTGLMYAVKASVAKDRGFEMCRCDGLPTRNRDGNAPHRKGTRGCKHHEDHVMEMALTKGTKTHSPEKRSELTDSNNAQPDW